MKIMRMTHRNHPPAFPFPTALGLGLVLALALAVPAASQQSSDLPASEATAFLGNWTLSLEIQGNAVEMTLGLSDVQGRVAANLSSAQRPEPTSITDIHKTDDGLQLSWERDFGGQPATLQMVLQLENDKLTGSFGDTDGFFSSEVSGVRATGGAAVAADGSVSAAEERNRERRRRRGGAQTELVLQGKKIRVAWAELDRGHGDYESLETLEAGKVFTFVSGRAIKLLTDASLRFGDTVIEKGNAASSYPGVYSLWLMKAPEGWHLVFNEHADIWGSQYDSAADVAHVTIESGTPDEQPEKLQLELVAVGDNAGLLRLAWGAHEWLAPFELVP